MEKSKPNPRRRSSDFAPMTTQAKEWAAAVIFAVVVLGSLGGTLVIVSALQAWMQSGAAS